MQYEAVTLKKLKNRNACPSLYSQEGTSGSLNFLDEPVQLSHFKF